VIALLVDENFNGDIQSFPVDVGRGKPFEPGYEDISA
jgi:hypothetical protein